MNDKVEKIIEEEVEKVFEDFEYNFPEGNYSISNEAVSFIYNWQWNKSELRKYQNGGLDAIPNSVVNELKKYRPGKEVECWRVFNDLEEELRSQRNKLISFMPYEEVALGMMEDYLHRRIIKPENILVDTTKIPNLPEDIIPEVIYINQ